VLTKVLAVLAVAAGCMVWGWLTLQREEDDGDCGECQLCDGDRPE